MAYCMYLRKSRADAEAEARGAGETLARHEAALLELARRENIIVTAIYREVVSGDTIASRPLMQQLLAEVEAGAWQGVLVMEVERLARGDSIDQGLVAQAFKYSGTLILTPWKTYNPSNEYDEEFFEFGLFMSRREYKTITRRMQQGRLAAAKEGKYGGARPPYGYDKVKLSQEKGYTLAIREDQAHIVRLIFQWYGEGLGKPAIAAKLNAMGAPTYTGKRWSPGLLGLLLRNPVYIGQIRWNYRKTQKTVKNGVLVCSAPVQKDYILAPGRHQAIISPEQWQRVQQRLAQNPAPPCRKDKPVKNPLAGLLYCEHCGAALQRRPEANGKAYLLCPTAGCPTVGCSFALAEGAVLSALAQLSKAYRSNPQAPWQQAQQRNKAALDHCRQGLAALAARQAKAYELVEQEIYSRDVFLERNQALAAEREGLQKELAALEAEAEELAAINQEQIRAGYGPQLQQVLTAYHRCANAQEQNELLKSVLAKVTYHKTSRSRQGNDFAITIQPRRPLE